MTTNSKITLILLELVIIIGSFIYFFIDTYAIGRNVILSIIFAIMLTMISGALLPLVVVLWWRLSTPAGREAEKMANILSENKKLERKGRRRGGRVSRNGCVGYNPFAGGDGFHFPGF